MNIPGYVGPEPKNWPQVNSYPEGARARTSLSNEYGSLAESLGLLGKHIEELEERLSPILTPPVPEPAQNGEQARDAARANVSLFAENIRSDVERVQRYINVISRIQSRLEL